MELIKDIYFNTDKLVENTNVKVSYTGKFYQGNNEKVFLHYGYGKDWNNLNEIEMKKTDLGYQAELQLLGDDTLNFCFKNQNNEWDNNFGKNYIFDIEKENQPIAESKENVNVFWGAKINNDENKEEPQDIPTQIDAVFGDNAIRYTNEFGTVDIASPVVKANEVAENVVAKKIEIPTTQATATTINNRTATNIQNPVNKNIQTSIALAPTGFEYWTKKIKCSVSSFFSNVPKFISGNYKRLIEKVK